MERIRLCYKIALYFSLILVVVGAVAFALLEWNGVMNGMSGFSKFTTSVFQSVTEHQGLTPLIWPVGIPMLFLLIVLMFIGASSSSLEVVKDFYFQRRII